MRPAVKTFWKYAFFPLAANLALAAHFISLDPQWHGLKGALKRLECMAGRQPVLVQGLHQGFAQGRAPAQRLLGASPEALRLETTDTPGWSQYAVPEGASAQVLTFEVRAAGEELVFYPRASGVESSVEAVLMDGDKAGPAVRLSGSKDQWSPMGARWTIPLSCADRDRPLVVRVTLKGPWAQLWTRGSEAFFEP